MCYQKKVARKSFYQKAIDSRGVLTYSRLRNKCGNEQETIPKEEKTQEEKDEAAYDCVSAEGNRHTDTNYNDDTYGLRMSLYIREIYKGR